ncbi:MAG: AraC family transcriptional regulator [Spirochaetales bacterium]
MKILDTVFVYRLKSGEKLTWHGRYHSHGTNEYEVHYFLEGEGSFLSNKARYPIRNNTLFLSGPHEFHSIIPERVTKPITFYAILFSVDEINDFNIYQLLTNALTDSKTCLFSNMINRFSFDEILRLSLSEQSSEKIAANFLLTSHLYRWYGKMISQSQTDEKSQKKINDTKSSQVYVNKAVIFMQKHMHEPTSVEHIAWHLDLSTEHFIRIFKHEMNITPHQYNIRLRVQEAAAKLIATDISIARISEKLGFENQFHFSRIFKKCTGFTPSAYRRHYSDSSSNTKNII